MFQRLCELMGDPAMAQNPRIAECLITHRLPLDAAEEAFAIAADRKAGAIKVTINP